MIIQWGRVKGVEGQFEIKFPIAFTITNYSAICKVHDTKDNGYESGAINTTTKTSMKANLWGNYYYSWFAIGY